MHKLQIRCRKMAMTKTHLAPPPPYSPWVWRKSRSEVLRGSGVQGSKGDGDATLSGRDSGELASAKGEGGRAGLGHSTSTPYPLGGVLPPPPGIPGGYGGQLDIGLGAGPKEEVVWRLNRPRGRGPVSICLLEILNPSPGWRWTPWMGVQNLTIPLTFARGGMTIRNLPPPPSPLI